MSEIIGWSYRTSMHHNWWHTGITLMVMAHLDGPDGKWKHGRHIFFPGTDLSFATVTTATRELIRRIAYDVEQEI